MDLFFVALKCVATMMLFVIPGFIGVKVKLWKPENISVLSLLLMYVVSPSMNIDSFLSGTFQKRDIGTALFFFVCGMIVQALVMTVSFLILRKSYADVRKKILTLATVLGNCGFMGIPILKAVLPEYPLAVPLSIFYALGMNILLYTMGFFIISGDRKYVSIKNLLLNPVTVSVIVGFGLFVLTITTPFEMPQLIKDAFQLLGSMATPLCLIVIGMRLATVRFKQLIDPVVFVAVAVKQLLVPLVMFFVLKLLPFEANFSHTLLVMTAVPVASMILMASEVLGEGQKEAASIVLVSTISSVVTIPLVMLLTAI